MPCQIAVLALLSPRLAIFALFLFTDVLARAWDSWVIPLIGFFILPWTTLAWAAMFWLGKGGVDGFEFLIVVFAFVIDIGSYIGGARSRGD